METIFFTSLNQVHKNEKSKYKKAFSFWTDKELVFLIHNQKKSLAYLSNNLERSMIAIDIKLSAIK